MGEIIRFISNSDRERERLIREARELYDRIFPPENVAIDGQRDGWRRRRGRQDLPVKRKKGSRHDQDHCRAV